MPRSSARSPAKSTRSARANSRANSSRAAIRAGYSPSGIWQSLNIILSALKEAAIKIQQDNCIGLAKEAAYSFILSFFPMLVAFIAFFFIWGDPQRSISEILITLRRMMPADSFKIVENYLRGMALNPNTELFWFSLAGAFWTASGIMSTLQNAFNVIYEVQSRRGFWMRRMVALLLVAGGGVPMIAATLVAIFGDQLEHYLARRYGFDFIWQQVWSIGRWAIVLLTTTSLAAFFYRVGVERQQSWRGVLPGAVLATTLWLLVTLSFNYYVQNFGSYNRVYGSLGAVIVLLIWMFLTALALLYGAAFNLALERRSAR